MIKLIASDVDGTLVSEGSDRINRKSFGYPETEGTGNAFRRGQRPILFQHSEAFRTGGAGYDFYRGQWLQYYLQRL